MVKIRVIWLHLVDSLLTALRQVQAFSPFLDLFFSSDRHSLLRTLHEIEPRHVIVYDAQMQFIRQLEVC